MSVFRTILTPTASILNWSLNHCSAFFTHFWNPHAGDCIYEYKILSLLFDFIRHECFPVERIVPLTGYTGIVKTFHCYMRLLEADAAEAERLFNELQYRWDISDSSLQPIHMSSRKCILDLNTSIKIKPNIAWPGFYCITFYLIAISSMLLTCVNRKTSLLPFCDYHRCLVTK